MGAVAVHKGVAGRCSMATGERNRSSADERISAPLLQNRGFVHLRFGGLLTCGEAAAEAATPCQKGAEAGPVEGDSFHFGMNGSGPWRGDSFQKGKCPP